MELSAQFLCALFKRGNDELTNTSCHTHAMLILQGSQVWSPREYSLFTSALFSCKLTFFSPDSPGVFSPGTKTFLIKNVLVIPYRASVTKSPTKSLKIQTETKHPINLNYAHTSINTHPMDFHPKFFATGDCYSSNSSLVQNEVDQHFHLLENVSALAIKPRES